MSFVLFCFLILAAVHGTVLYSLVADPSPCHSVSDVEGRNGEFTFPILVTVSRESWAQSVICICNPNTEDIESGGLLKI